MVHPEKGCRILKSKKDATITLKKEDTTVEFSIGIASNFSQQRQYTYVIDNDENAISFETYSGLILKGNEEINRRPTDRIIRSTKRLSKMNSGDEIHFRFQSKLKKLSISLV